MPDKQPGAEANLPARSSPSKEIIPLGQQGLDISSLPEAERNQLKARFVERQMELSHKAQELGIDNQAIENRLGDMAEKVKQASDGEASATITGAYEDSMGRTEVIMGNTETAAKGKLDRTQKGQQDQTLTYIVIAAVVIIILAAIIMKG